MTAAKKLAREYELVYILRPSVTPAEAKKVAERLADVVAKQGAKLTRVDNWGKRKLAYIIQKANGRHSRGIFVYVRCVGYDGLVAELERNLRNLDDVIRFQTVRLEALYDLAELAVDPEEVQFRDIEVTTEDEEEPSFEESLGMRQRERRRDRDDEVSPDEDEPVEDEDEDDVLPKAAKPEAPAATPAAPAAPSEEEE